MCGRTACTLAPEEIQAQTGAKSFEEQGKYRPSYNVSPHTFQPVLIWDEEGQCPIIKMMRWGLVPSWSKKGDDQQHLRTINARDDHLTTHSMWKRLLKDKRCLVLANGYFEWQQTSGGQKHPFFIHHKDTDQLMTFAGLWDCWTDPTTKEKLYTYTVITTQPHAGIQHIHDRMPMILETEAERETWLRVNKDDPSLYFMRVIGPKKEEEDSKSSLVADEVTTFVNNPRNDSPKCLESLQHFSRTRGIQSFFPTLKQQPKAKKEEEAKKGEEAKKEEEGKGKGKEKLFFQRVKAEPKEEEEEEEEREERPTNNKRKREEEKETGENVEEEKKNKDKEEGEEEEEEKEETKEEEATARKKQRKASGSHKQK
ncbi:Muscle M-line assembly protein unc-89 [Balamuthia mandrillaris]